MEIFKNKSELKNTLTASGLIIATMLLSTGLIIIGKYLL